MKNGIEERHIVDRNGNPAGGYAKGIGIDIQWQDGPLGTGEDRKEPNGAFIEDVLEAVIERLRFYQRAGSGKFACRENSIALTHLQTAALWLDKRTRGRIERGVEGTHQS